MNGPTDVPGVRCAHCFAAQPLHSNWIMRGPRDATGAEGVAHFCSLQCAGTHQTVESIHEAAQNRAAGVPPERSGALAGFLIGALLTAGAGFVGEPAPRGAAENLGLSNKERRRRDLKRRRRRNRRKRQR